MIHTFYPTAICCGIVIQHAKIAEYTYHIKIQSVDLSSLKYLAGLTTEVYLSNPFYDSGALVRKFSVWNFDPVFNTIDFAINTKHEGPTSAWAKSLQIGDNIFFKEPKPELSLDETATDYLLIGNVTSLAYLYELNRAIAVSKNVHSLVFANDAKEIFQDIDHSFPLDSYILDFKNPAELTKLLNENLPELSKNNVAYIAGDATEVALIHNFLKSNSKFSMDKIHYKNFRTEEK